MIVERIGKNDRVDYISARTNLSKNTVRKVLDADVELARTCLFNGVSYEIWGLGNFHLRYLKALPKRKNNTKGLTDMEFLPPREECNTVACQVSHTLKQEMKQFTKGKPMPINPFEKYEEDEDE